MSAVWKYTFNTFTEDFSMPEGAKPLHVAKQYKAVCLWALVDPSRPKVQRRFVMVATGADVDDLDPEGYVGTVQTDGGGFELVWHVFERGRTHGAGAPPQEEANRG